ncbi:hypothetical protein E6O75_ATG00423 [Venturia nashicola]|uniref:Protein BIG1 n=1 Tax=Venturia nashicola TaxID=86259 RepID=A0A4Z1PGC4_9PEZI|nr:hypothetical protein E6O75_ATG00423 [Venturia nashicola]
MATRRLWAAALALQSVTAFKDTSPFFFFSTSTITSTHLQNTQLASSSSLSSQIYHFLSLCPAATYIIVSQPGVSATDYSPRLSAPHLRHLLNRTEKTGPVTVTVPEVVGNIDAHRITRYLEDQCSAEILKADAATGTIPNDGNYPRIVRVEFSTLPSQQSDRVIQLGENDAFFHAVISELGGRDFVVVFTTTPPEDIAPIAPDQYEMEDSYNILHTDLKRDVGSHASSNGTNLPLFETYQFLSPAIFMGLMVSFLLFMILYVGITAVASLQVSYFAFSKEMGPSGQKKAQ